MDLFMHMVLGWIGVPVKLDLFVCMELKHKGIHKGQFSHIELNTQELSTKKLLDIGALTKETCLWQMQIYTYSSMSYSIFIIDLEAYKQCWDEWNL